MHSKVDLDTSQGKTVGYNLYIIQILLSINILLHEFMAVCVPVL